MKLRILQVLALLDLGAALGLLTRIPSHLEEADSLAGAAALFSLVGFVFLLIDFVILKWRDYKVLNRNNR